MRSTDPPALRYHYRPERLVAGVWEAVDEERFVLQGPLSAGQAIEVLQQIASRHGGVTIPWRLVEDVVHTAVRAELGEIPPARTPTTSPRTTAPATGSAAVPDKV